MSYYKTYVHDTSFHEEYVTYQQRYRDNVRESDKVLCRLLKERLHGIGKAAILDVGCSNGNLLRFLRSEMPEHAYTGGDLSPVAIRACRADASLTGVEFAVIDALDIGRDQAFDAVIANAVLYLFSEKEYQECLASIFKALRPGGILILFDFAHPYHQRLCIQEHSASHPEGLALHFRPMREVEAAFTQAGFVDVEFRPFEITIDLPMLKPTGTGSFEDLCTYTLKAEDGRRLLFRGALYQPWCHITSRKGDRR